VFDVVGLQHRQQRFGLRVEVAGGARGLQQHVYVVAVQCDRRAVPVTGPRQLVRGERESSIGLGTDGSVAGRRLLAQRRVPAVMVVILFPVADDYAGLR
jgi:hypothetical protein